MRAHNRCNDIEGAQPKKMRQRSVPTNPLDPAYQPLESIVLPPKARVSRDELEEEKALGAGPVPWSGTASLGMDASGHLLHLSRQTELAELWKSQGELSMQGRRTRKDYRDTNKTSDIEGAQPAPLLGRNGEVTLVSSKTNRKVADLRVDHRATCAAFTSAGLALNPPDGVWGLIGDSVAGWIAVSDRDSRVADDDDDERSRTGLVGDRSDGDGWSPGPGSASPSSRPPTPGISPPS